ncbi:MAG: phenylalanine--tRNA ligase subunit beta [Solibacterales bacterium]|nr:phenylalanine--tRNA ligase subunit beta [Bryobacterales bacterium]|tara:strand:- start:1230 stop:3263 length:2034 start_codon:yes stop_codon:yes gene_type:complete
MEILLSWLRDFVDIPESPTEVAEALTLAGLAVDAIRKEGNEHIFELDITANRPDALSHLGVAREISAIYDRSLRMPASKISTTDELSSSRASVEILATELCSRYSARVLSNVVIKPSPDWLRRRLELCGIRPINNIADLTNYVLLETGHPTHAFDLDLLKQAKIVVRTAKSEETLQTLDGMLHNLTTDHLVIADMERSVALAGVMGGLETEISRSTRNVLLEAAWFDPGSIRRTSRRFGMHTEASHRFERGADIEATVWALERLAHWFGQVSSGDVLEGVIDNHPGQTDRAWIDLRPTQISRVLGTDVSRVEVERILTALGFTVNQTGETWKIKLSSHRLDIEREIDLVEEVARIHGYHHVPKTLPFSTATVQQPPNTKEEARTRELLRALGYDETIAYSFIRKEEATQFGREEAVEIRNPVSELWAVMRNTAMPTMIQALGWNLNRNEPDIKLMEIGRLYMSDGSSFQEPKTLVLGACGMARRSTPSNTGKEVDFYDLKSDVECLLSDFQVEQLSFEATAAPDYYQREQSARIVANRKTLGYLGMLDVKVAAAHKIKCPIFVAEIDLDSLWNIGLRKQVFQTVPKVPASHRDFSLLIPKAVSFADICDAVGQQKFLVRLEPIEIFHGDQVLEGFYGLLIRAAWQKDYETLTDGEINEYATSLVENLSKTLGVQQRS